MQTLGLQNKPKPLFHILDHMINNQVLERRMLIKKLRISDGNEELFRIIWILLIKLFEIDKPLWKIWKRSISFKMK